MGRAEYRQFFRITDPEQARLLSDWLGQRTVCAENRSAKGEAWTGLAGVPLIRPEELAGLARGRQILIVPEGRPVFEEVVPFFKRDDWRGGRSPRTRIAGQGAKPGRRCLALGAVCSRPREYRAQYC